MKIRMTNNVRLPYNVARGSEIERFNSAAKSNREVFKSIKKDLKNSFVDVETLREALNKQISPMITYLISPDNRKGSNAVGGTVVMISKIFKELSGYDILLPLSEHNQLHVQDLHIAMHEFRHIFDMINNPKINQRKILMYEFEDAGYKIDYIDNVYQRKIYTSEKLNKNDIQDTFNFLLPLFNEKEQITILQMLRYRLKLEHNAYLEASKFQRELKTIYGDKFNKNDYMQARAFKFPQKIKIIESKLKDLLIEIRQKHAENIKHHPCR